MKKTAKKKTAKKTCLKFQEIIEAADRGYGSDGVVLQYHEGEDAGDTLAKFVEVELRETFDNMAGRDDQIDEAERVIESAIRELQGVLNEISNLREE